MVAMRRVLGAAMALALLGTPVLVASPASAVTPCSAGLVALTFDDGPSQTQTPRLVRILTDRHVPATFFMVGQRVASAPSAARLVARSHFVIGNHTWDHPDLTRLGSAAIRRELVAADRAMRAVGIRPSNLMRPPYGAINDRVRSVAASLGLRPVLWTIDPRDWESGTSSQIAGRVLGALRPHRTNIVLQHDGVRNSPASVGAVPTIVRVARGRGYCFTTLGRDGLPAVPVPIGHVSLTTGREAGPVPIAVTIHLDRPTTRAVSVRLRTADGTATAGKDYTARSLRVWIPAGHLRATVHIWVHDDALHEPDEWVKVRFAYPIGMHLAATSYGARIVSDDPLPPPPPPPPPPA